MSGVMLPASPQGNQRENLPAGMIDPATTGYGAGMLPYPRAGETVGPYRIERRLGEGENSVVYAATQMSSNRQVALKVMSSDVAADTASRRRVTLAARQAVSVSSPHVARVHLYGEDGARLYIASDLVTDGTLARLLATQGPAPVLAGLDLMAQVATGLAAVHERGLVHGAVTPANVLVQWREGRAMALLGDVGIGRHDTAPEVLHGAPPRVASDIHSMGALVWATLTGGPVHHGTPYQVARGYVLGPMPRLMGASPRVGHLNAVLARAMHHDPTRRHTSALQLRHDLVTAMSLPGEPGPLRPASIPSTRPDPRTTRTVTLVALALVLVGLTVGAVLLISSF